MNTKSLVLAAAFGLGSLSFANATVTVYMSGSTAGRSQVHNILQGNVGGLWTAAPAFSYYSGKTWSYFSNYSSTINDSLIVKCHWSGSEGGVADLNDSTRTPTFLLNIGSGTPAVVAGDNGSAAPVAAQLESHSVDVACADASVVFSKTPNADIVGAQLGVITFKFVKEKGSSASLNNITDALFRSSLKNGGVKLSLLTGNEADTGWVYISGRDSDSGTRVNTLGFTGYGIFNGPKQIQVSSNDTTHVIFISAGPGDVGYSGGGPLATQMGYDLTGASDTIHAGAGSFSVIGYLGTSDAATAVANGGTEITYNGVAFSQANIEHGQYNGWGNYYIYEGSAHSGTSDGPDTVFNHIATQITSQATSDSFIQFGDMFVKRTGPTGDPFHK